MELGAGSCPGRDGMDSKSRAILGSWEEQLAQFTCISTLCCGLFLPPKGPPAPSTHVQSPSRPSLPPALILLPLHPPDLLLKILSLEGEQEPAHVVLTQLVDATGINGTAQELVHLIFRVQSILGTPADNGTCMNNTTKQAVRRAGLRQQQGKAR